MKFIPRHKIRDQPVFSSAGEEARFDKLLTTIGKYNNKFDANQALEAIFWAKKTTAERGHTLPHDIFSDPLIIAEKLAHLGQADETTIIASILYPCVRPDGNNRIREGDFGAIRDRFDQQVHDTVCATLALRAIDYRPLQKQASSEKDKRSAAEIRKDEEAKEKQHIKDFRTMALFATTKFLKSMPWAIPIRAVQYLTYVEALQTARGEVRDDILFMLNHVHAELAGIAGFWKIKEALQNEWLRIMEPKLFAEIQKVIGEQTAKGHAKRKELLDQVVKQAVMAMERTKIPRRYYEIEAHLKSPYAIFKKMVEKGIRIDQLHEHVKDFIQLGVTLDADAYHEDQPGGYNRRQRRNPPRYEETEYDLCRMSHKAFTKVFKQVEGPYKDPDDKQTIILKNGERRQAHQVDLVRDRDQIIWHTRFKDYMKVPNAAELANRKNKIPTPVYGPKANRYSAMHDVVIMPVGNSKNEVDLHIDTKRRRKVNLYGIGAHGSYKTSAYKSEATADQALVDWYTAVRGEDSQGRRVEKAPYWMGAYAENNRIVLRHGPMNLAEFAMGIGPKKVANCLGGHAIEGGGPYGNEENGPFPLFPKPDKTGFYPLDAELQPGMKVRLVIAEGSHRENVGRVMPVLRRRADRLALTRHIGSLDAA